MANLEDQIQELRGTLGKMEIALGSVDEAIVWTDHQGRIQWCNSTFDKLVKKIHILILGQQLTDLLVLSKNGTIVDKSLHPVTQALENKSRGKEQYEIEEHNRRLVLEISWSYLQIPSSLQQNTHVGSAVVVIQDISERKAAEIFLQQAKHELEQRVKERTQELITLNRQLVEHNIALEEAKKIAETASKIKSEFLATMSHETRTPLNAVIGLTELLLNTELDSTQADFVNTIRSSGEMLLTLINDILDFSKIETGQLKLIQETIDLKSLVDSSIDIIDFQAKAKKIKLINLIESPIPQSIIGDANRLNQILLNLLNNAVKFTEIGEVCLSLKSKKLNLLDNNLSINSFPTYELEFCIQDTGIGISKTKVSQLFQPFRQLDASMSRKYGGTGLGLAISQKLVEMMGGKIWVETQEGLGSKFFFTIIASETQTLVQKIPQDNKNFKDFTGKQILIVDANKITQQVLIQQTQSWGMLNCAVSTTKQAFSLISKEINFDLIILDLDSLDTDITTLIREFAQQDKYKTIPIILLFSQNNPEINGAITKTHNILTLKKTADKTYLYELIKKAFTIKEIQPNSTSNITSTTKSHPTSSQNPSLRILLAEDNLVNQKVALLVLKQIGYHADVANNGLEVLEALKQQTYDVVLMDVQMPEMDGLSATREICQKWSHSQRPRIIALTANAMPGDREICLNAGMDDYITKPIRVENLRTALSKC